MPAGISSGILAFGNRFGAARAIGRGVGGGGVVVLAGVGRRAEVGPLERHGAGTLGRSAPGNRTAAVAPLGGLSVARQSLAAATAFGGISVSTTHTITGAIMGVGATKRLSAVRWGVAGRIVIAWILTIPLSAAVSALTYLILSPLFR